MMSGTATVKRMRDPVLGFGWCWVIVCDFHGVVGRWLTKHEASTACVLHNTRIEHPDDQEATS